MNDENKVNEAIKKIDQLIDEGAIQNLSDDQLSKVSELIAEIQKKLSE
ncbi:MAG: hypothetical protein IKK43_06150 [Clostridia bacterium]|nr:hypothetical protein [Clostridia bacterium]